MQPLQKVGGHKADFSDESSQIDDSDFDSENFEEEPIDIFEAQCFTKHGFDLLMISNNSKNSLYQNLLNNKDDANLRIEKEGSNNMNATISQLMNKRAQALYMSREEES